MYCCYSQNRWFLVNLPGYLQPLPDAVNTKDYMEDKAVDALSAVRPCNPGVLLFFFFFLLRNRFPFLSLLVRKTQ
jgi:hypothetical protein